jgi:superfamily II DNA or RNA helicase
MLTLFDYQESAVTRIRKLLKIAKRVLLQSATGSGKTVMAVALIQQALAEDPNRRFVILTNKLALLPQFEETFRDFGMRHLVSVLHERLNEATDKARLVYNPERPILLTMAETYFNVVRDQVNVRMPLHNWRAADPYMIIIDEAHYGTSEMFQYICNQAHPNALVVGLTATPTRMNNDKGESLAEWYADNLVTTVSMKVLIEQGKLSRPRYIKRDSAAHLVNTYLEVTSGDTCPAAVVFIPQGPQNMRETYDAFCTKVPKERVAIITAVDNEEHGLKAQEIKERQEILRRFEAGDIWVLITVDALAEGFDSKRAKYCFLYRKVTSKGLYQQMVGRVLRWLDGKPEGIVVDFFGNVDRFGPVEELVWTALDMEATTSSDVLMLGAQRVVSMDRANNRKLYIHCEDCGHLYDPRESLSCTYRGCGKKHGLQVEVSASAWLAEYFPRANSNMLMNLLFTLGKAIRLNDSTAISRLMAGYPEVFSKTNDVLEIHETYQPLYEIIGMRPRTEKDLKKAIRYAA